MFQHNTCVVDWNVLLLLLLLLVISNTDIDMISMIGISFIIILAEIVQHV